MKLLNKIGMPALLLGAAFFVTPAMAQNDENAPSSDNPAAAAPAQPSQDANRAAAHAQSAQDAAPAQSAKEAAPAQSAQDTAMPAASASSSSAGTQLAMNTTGNASDLSSIPDNQHKYSRARRSADNRSEGATTKELNEKEASLNGASGGNAQ